MDIQTDIKSLEKKLSEDHFMDRSSGSSSKFLSENLTDDPNLCVLRDEKGRYLAMIAPKRRETIVVLVYLALILSLLLVMFISYFSVTGYNLQSMASAAQSLEYNLNQDPITLITPSQNTTCEGGSELVELGLWTGTQAGCCHNNEITKGSCTNTV